MSLFGGNKENYKDKKSLIIYFSRADENYAVGNISKGNTEVIAEYIKEFTNADMFKVERKVPYSANYRTCTEESAEEQRTNARPELVNYLDDISEYEVIYVGGPIYWGTLPNPMFTELERLNWNGKIVRPFTTHEGSGLGNVVNDLRKICVGAEVKDGLAIRGATVGSARNKVEDWI